MVDTEVALVGSRALGVAIRQLLDQARDRTEAPQQNEFQQRMRFAGLVESGRDIAALAQAAVVLLRRSGHAERP